MPSNFGCSAPVRGTVAALAFVVGGAFLYASLQFHRSLDAIIRIPFVLGSLVIGMMIIGAGIRVLFMKAE